MPGAHRGGVVTVSMMPAGVGLPEATLDPSGAYFPDANAVLSGLVTRSLTQWVFDPGRDGMVLIPDLATDLGRPNADYTKWTYTIRPGVRFEDGAPVTAADVAYGIERSFDRKDFPAGATYSNQYFLNGDTYLGPDRSGTDYSGIRVDGDTLTISMARPFTDMPYWGAFPAMGPIPATGANPKTYGLHPLATGPYKVAHYQPGLSLTLVRNPEWDPGTDPGRHAYPDEYRFVPEGSGPPVLTDRGEAQTSISEGTQGATRQDLARAPSLVVSAASPCVKYAAIDYRKVPDLRVREAIGYAFPYQRDLAYNQLASDPYASLATTLRPKQDAGRVDYQPLSTPPGQTDPAKAKELLKEAGFAPGDFALSWAYQKSGVQEKRFLVRAFDAAGFSAKPYRVASNEAVLATRGDPRAPVNLRLNGWCEDWPSGSASEVNLLTSSGGDPTRSFSFFDKPSVDQAAQKIQTLPLDQQAAAWGALDKRIETDYYPVVIRFQEGITLLHGSRIGGLKPDNVFATPTWKDIYLLR